VTWTDITGNNTAGGLNTLAVNPSQGSRVLAGGLNGVSGTTTSGTQWSVQTAGLNSTFMLGFSADAGADRIYMNVQSGGVYYSAAGAAATAPVNNFGSGGLMQLSGQTTLFVTGMLAQPGACRRHCRMGSRAVPTAEHLVAGASDPAGHQQSGVLLRELAGESADDSRGYHDFDLSKRGRRRSLDSGDQRLAGQLAKENT